MLRKSTIKGEAITIAVLTLIGIIITVVVAPAIKHHLDKRKLEQQETKNRDIIISNSAGEPIDFQLRSRDLKTGDKNEGLPIMISSGDIHNVDNWVERELIRERKQVGGTATNKSGHEARCIFRPFENNLTIKIVKTFDEKIRCDT